MYKRWDAIQHHQSMKHRLAKFLENKKLVSIRRSKIDDHSIQGFVLGFSDDLVILQYVMTSTWTG